MNVSVSDVGIKQSRTRPCYCWGYLVQPVLINGVQQFIMLADTTLIHTILCPVRGGGPLPQALHDSSNGVENSWCCFVSGGLHTITPRYIISH